MKRKFQQLSLILLICFCSSLCLVSFGGCFFLQEQEDYCVQSIEEAKEYFPDYIPGVNAIVESYGREYSFEQSEEDENFNIAPASYVLYNCYSFSENLYLELALIYWESSDRESNYSHFLLKLCYNQAEKLEDLEKITSDYSEMLYKISDYCGHNIPGDEQTFLSAYQTARKKFDNSRMDDTGIKWSYTIKNQSLFSYEWEGDFLSITYKNNTARYYLIMQSGYFLSDKNLSLHNC